MSKFGFLKISVVSPFLKLADPKNNAQLISKIAKDEIKKGVSIVVFPQLSLSGCSCGSLFANEFLIDETKKAVNWLAVDLKSVNVCCIVGLCVKVRGRLLNCAAVIFKGRVQGLVVKNEIFNECDYDRGFCTLCEPFYYEEIFFNGLKTPLGSHLVFKLDDAVFVVKFSLNCVGLEQTFLSQGVNLVFCLLALEFCGCGQINQINLAKALSFNLNCAVAFVNTGLFESSTDCVYCGFGGFSEAGKLVKFEEQDSFENLVLDCDVDVLQFSSGLNSPVFKLNQNDKVKLIDLEFVADDFNLTRIFSKTPYIIEYDVGVKCYCLQILKAQVMALARRVKHVKAKRLILGVSGGLDSTLALLVAVRVCEFLKIKTDSVLAVFMPGFGTSEQAKKNVLNLVSSLKVDFKEISIVKACEQHFNDINHSVESVDLVFENAQARERSQILFDLANEFDGLVLGTADMSEIALGFSTFGGDHLAGYGVNCGVCKTLIRKIIEVVANESDDLLKSVLFDVLKMPISPELVKNKGVSDKDYQKTEEILGPYLLHDFFIFYFVKFGFSVEKVKFLAFHVFSDVFNEVEIERALKIFVRRFFSQQFKRSCSPDGAKMMSFSLSPRTDLKIASDCNSDLFLAEM